MTQATIKVRKKIIIQSLFDMPKVKKISEFKFIDLFAGIGGIRIGFECVGGECVFTSEWDESAKKTYQTSYFNRLY